MDNAHKTNKIKFNIVSINRQKTNINGSLNEISGQPNYTSSINSIINNDNNNSSSSNNALSNQIENDKTENNKTENDKTENDKTENNKTKPKFIIVPKFVITPKPIVPSYNNTGWYVYILQSMSYSTSTYVGKTNDLVRRLRQHNGELKCGGAKRTKRNRPWKYFCYISGFPDEKCALQFEWRMHHPPNPNYRKRKNNKTVNNQRANNKKGPYLKGIPRRVKNLRDVLTLNRWTSNAPLALSVVLMIHWKEERYDLNLNLPHVLEE